MMYVCNEGFERKNDLIFNVPRPLESYITCTSFRRATISLLPSTWIESTKGGGRSNCLSKYIIGLLLGLRRTPKCFIASRVVKRPPLDLAIV